MKFGQIWEYNMKNIFLEKPYTKCGGETSPRPFSEKLKLSLYFYSFWNFIQFVLLQLQVDDYHNVLKLSCRPFVFTFYKGFLKKKRNLELAFLSRVMHGFCRKSIALVYTFNWPSFIVWLFLLPEILGNICIVIVC